jgi:hypothetical protein
MKLYCLVENGIVVDSVTELPMTFANVSNFNVLDDSELKTHGWLPCYILSENKDIVVSVEYEIYDEYVNKIIITRDKTDNECNQKRSDKDILNDIRAKRDALLSESDKAIVSDLWSDMDEHTRESWKKYRQSLRDIPQLYTSTHDVDWPISPLLQKVIDV